MPTVGPATRAMIPEVARLMARHFQKSEAFFQDMLGLDWGFGFDEIGKALFDGGRIVGFFGLHHSVRRIRGSERRISAMHGVVIEPDYRKGGTDALTECAVGDPEGHYVAWTANPAMDRRYRRAGFRPQNAEAKLVWPGGALPSLAAAPFLRPAGMAEFEAAADPDSRRIFRDHRGGRFREHLFFAFGRPLGLLTRRTYHQRRFPITELAYVSDARLLERAFEPVRLAVHRRERTVALKINPPEIGFRPRFAQAAPGGYLYKSKVLGPGDFNILYGELLLLG